MAEGAVGSLEELYAHDGAPPAQVRPGDVAAMLYTSGTTGRSKACMLPHRYFLSQAAIAIRDLGLVRDDVLYCPFPLFHVDATALTVVPSLLTGAAAAVARRFSASGFWNEIEKVGATVFDFMGATLSILDKAEPRDDDANNPVRLAWGVPVPDWVEQFEQRFDLQVVELYGSTEANIPIVQRFDSPRIKGSCGTVRPEFEIRIVDDNDDPLGPGEVGELLVRPRHAHTMFSGYYGSPDATVEVIANLWFHTGDLAKTDDRGNVYFIGRRKEVIRRRGENISAIDLEEAILAHPVVAECAVVAVPSELTEDDIKAVVKLREGMTLTPEELLLFCETNLARFQVPRYLEFVTTMPKTPTGKIEKFRFVDPPFNARTWDATKGGYLAILYSQ